MNETRETIDFFKKYIVLRKKKKTNTKKRTTQVQVRKKGQNRESE